MWLTSRRLGCPRGVQASHGAVRRSGYSSRGYKAERCVMYLTQGLRRAAQIRPQEQSTVFRARRRIWSETADRVARIAGGLAEAGVRPGDRVAILALNSDRYFELMYAIPWLGAAMVPVNTRLATPEVRYILEDSGARVLFIDDAMKAHAF